MRTLKQIETDESCDHQTARVIQKMEALSDRRPATGSVFDYDKAYHKWSGDHHTTNSGRKAHDSADAMDFAQFCVNEVLEQNDLNEGC